MHNKETIKYIASNIWSSWNPLKWSQSMQLAAVSYILSCLVRSSTADLAGDVPLTSEEKGEFSALPYLLWSRKEGGYRL